MEEIITFLPGQLPGEERFGIEMAGITYPDSRYHVRRENSRIHCIEYVIEGSGYISIDGRHYTASAGDVYLLAAGKTHDYGADSKTPWEKIWLNVYGELSDTLIRSYGLDTQAVFCGCSIYPLFREFLRICASYEKNSAELAERTVLLFHEILIKLSAHMLDGRKERNKTDEPALLVKEYIDANIYEKISMEILAKTANLSLSQMTRVFKNMYGQSPYDYVLSRKIDTACLLLLDTGLSVKEIAYRLSFADEHYFSNVFKKRTGLPPGKYRETGERTKNLQKNT